MLPDLTQLAKALQQSEERAALACKAAESIRFQKKAIELAQAVSADEASAVTVPCFLPAKVVLDLRRLGVNMLGGSV